MEWKRTARNIAGSLRAFPVQNRLNRSIQISVGYLFARAIMEKYQRSEDEYGSLSASFVYLDGTLGQGVSEHVRELIDELTVLYKLRVSVLNQSYERNFYLAVNMRCEQMFAALERNLSWQAEIRELKSIWQTIKEDFSGEKGRESGRGPESWEGLESRERLRSREGLESRERLGSREGLESRERLGSRERQEKPENWERSGNRGRLENRANSGNRKELESRDNPGNWEDLGSWEEPGNRERLENRANPGNRKELENRENLENREEPGNRDNPGNRERPENQESQEYQENLWNRQGLRDGAEERLNILRDQVQARILENAGKAGALFPSFGDRAGERGSGSGAGSGILASPLSRTASAGFPKGGKEAGAKASVLYSWKSPQARRFFWRIQRASWWEQQVVLEASGANSLSQLMNRLRSLEGEAWTRFFPRLRERAESCMEDSEFLSRLISEAAEKNIPSPFLSASRSPKTSGDISPEEPFAERERPAEGRSLPEGDRVGEEKGFSAEENEASLSPMKESVPLAHLKELMRLLIHQEGVWAGAESQRETFDGGTQQEEMLLSLLEQGRILELLQGREEKSWLDQAREAVFGLTLEEWQAFKEELLKESGLLSAKAGHADSTSLVSGWLLGPEKGVDAEKEMLLETVFQVQRFFRESMSGQQEPEIRSTPVGEGFWEEIRQLRSRLTEEPSVFGELTEEYSVSKELSGLLNEGIRRLKRVEELESCYRAVTEAVSYLGVGQWEQLKEELFSAEPQEEEMFPGTVLHWLLEERKKEERRDGEYSAQDGMAGEKRGFLKALMAEAENKAISIRQKEQVFGQIFAKSRVLSEYIDWDQRTFQSGAGTESPDTSQAPDLKGQELSAALSSLTGEEWERLIEELPAIERERLHTIHGDREAVRGLWELFRDFPESQGREGELRHQKQEVLRFLSQSGPGRESLGEFLEEELRRLEISGKRRILYQSLTEAASCMTREEWKTFQREVAEAFREETGEKDAIGLGMPDLKWLARPEAGNAEEGSQGEKGGTPERTRQREAPDQTVPGSRAAFSEETVPMGEGLRELMEMSEEKQEFLKALAGRLFSEEAPETEERPEKSQGDEYRYWERVFRKSGVLSRYVSWEETGAQAGKRGTGPVEARISRLDAKGWEEFRSGMEKRLFRTLSTGRKAGEDTGHRKAVQPREIWPAGSGQKPVTGIFGQEFLPNIPGENFLPASPRHRLLPSGPGQRPLSGSSGEEFLPGIPGQEFWLATSGQKMSGALTLRRGRGHEVESATAGAMRAGNFRELADGFREFAGRFREAVEEIFSVSSPLPLPAGEMFRRLSSSVGEWDLGKERGTAAAVGILENLRQSRVTANPENLRQTQATANPESLRQSRVIAKETEPEVWDYGTASLVVTQSGAARDNRRLPPETVRPEIKSEVTRQVQEQTGDIRFISRTQASGQEITAESQTELKALIRQVEQQQRELKELQKKQETAMQKAQLPQISRSVMKQLQGQLQMEGLRHGR